ncbi:protection of telomeres protein 1-like [Ptychodera flava]|uniref:protection of telomeres protein 1-like n=1 Tax=Ptychodera flava TaxID=63121 RepID=UPI00396A2568
MQPRMKQVCKTLHSDMDRDSLSHSDNINKRVREWTRGCREDVNESRDTIIISDFIVQMSPTAWSDHGHKCQIAADFIKADFVNVLFMGKKYTKLKLLKGGEKVDVYGIAKFLKPPFKTEGNRLLREFLLLLTHHWNPVTLV